MLSAYCDIVGRKYGLRVQEKLVLLDQSGTEIPVDGEVVASTPRSLILRIAGRASVVKLLPVVAAELETRLHKLADNKSPHLRRLMAVYTPLGFPEFQALELEGFGQPLTSYFIKASLNWPLWNAYFEQVCNSTNLKRVRRCTFDAFVYFFETSIKMLSSR